VPDASGKSGDDGARGYANTKALGGASNDRLAKRPASFGHPAGGMPVMRLVRDWQICATSDYTPMR
jgi:hypothetical protein